MNEMKHGVFQEGDKFVVYFDGQVVRKARLEERANSYFAWMVKTKGSDTKPTVKVAPQPKEPTAVAYTAPNTAAYVPEKDVHFIPFGDFAKLNTIIKSGAFFPVFITGPTGNGKSTMVEQSCARNGRKYIRLQINSQSDEDQLIGSKTLVDGNIQIVEGPVLIAMRTGSVLLLDECLEENEKVRIGTVDSWVGVKLKDLEKDTIYPVVSFNMDTANFENDEAVIISEREDELYEVELEDGRTVTLNANHPFIVEQDGSFVQKSINDGLKIGDTVVIA